MRRFVPIFLSLLFLAVHYGSILYVNSSLLSSYFAPGPVGILYVLGALGSLILFLFAHKFVKLFGKRILLALSIFISILGTLGLALFDTAYAIALSFIIYTSVIAIIFYALDIYLEELSTDEKTGEIRGIYLTVIALGIAIGPFALAVVTSALSGYRPVYLLSAAFLVLPFLLSLIAFKSDTPKTHKPYHHSIRLPWKTWWHSISVRRATFARLVLESFFGFMVAYTPLYLHVNLGFEWPELGIMFTIMLLPFILLEWPAGELADRLLGEKELMIVGFLITIGALLAMPFIGKDFILWTLILLISRVGASLIEAMTESYFFKHVDATDTGILSIFRLMRPVGSVGGVVIGVLSLLFVTIDQTFLILAFVMFLGLKESLLLRDTRPTGTGETR